MLKGKSRLLVVGGGDFGREVLWAASEVPESERDWEPAGFLDDDVASSQARMRAAHVSLPVLGTIKDYHPQPGDVLVNAIAHPRTKLEVCETLQKRGGRFISLIHPTVALAPGVILGTGVVLLRNVIVSVNARIDDFVIANFFCSIGHDTVLEAGCTLSCHCDVTGHVYLERGAFLGSHAAVLPGGRVGAFATVGAGSVVLKKVDAGRTAMGVPAKHIT